MKIIISSDLQKILAYARDEALRTGNYAISVDHLMLGLLRDKSGSVSESLRQCGIDTMEMKKLLDSKLFCENSIPYCDIDKISVSNAASSAVSLATMEALRCGVCEVEPRHLLLAIAKGTSSESYNILNSHTADLAKELNCETARTVTPNPMNFTHIVRINPDNDFPS